MKRLAIVIAARNEEKVLGRTLGVLTNMVSYQDIYLVSDGSNDRTDEIAANFRVNLLHNNINIGKTLSLKKALYGFKILKNYSYVFLLDADTIPHRNFFKYILTHFKNRKVACVCGQVAPEPRFNLYVTYRVVLYYIWQNLYKKFANLFNGIGIAPGTASIYRSRVLRKIKFDQKLLIEDFDLTFQVHRKNLGKIIYEPKAIVITQDPDNLFDYYRQLKRWNIGFFQTAFKHKIPLHFQPFEILTFIFIIQELIHLIFITVLIPVFLYLNFLALYPRLFGVYIEIWLILYLLFIDMLVVWVFSLVSLVETKRYKELVFVFFLWGIQFINLTALIAGFYQAIFGKFRGRWVSPKRR